MTLTEFNQNPSRASGIAESGEDVIVTRHGAPTLLLTRLHKRADPIDAAIRAGRMRPPRSTPGRKTFPVLDVDRQSAAAAIAQFEAERDVRVY